MRKLKNVKVNIDCSDEEVLDATLYNALKKHRWDRKPAVWSQ